MSSLHIDRLFYLQNIHAWMRILCLKLIFSSAKKMLKTRFQSLSCGMATKSMKGGRVTCKRILACLIIIAPMLICVHSRVICETTPMLGGSITLLDHRLSFSSVTHDIHTLIRLTLQVQTFSPSIQCRACKPLPATFILAHCRIIPVYAKIAVCRFGMSLDLLHSAKYKFSTHLTSTGTWSFPDLPSPAFHTRWILNLVISYGGARTVENLNRWTEVTAELGALRQLRFTDVTHRLHATALCEFYFNTLLAFDRTLRTPIAHSGESTAARRGAPQRLVATIGPSGLSCRRWMGQNINICAFFEFLYSK